jgi:hypothetical protein
MRAKLLTVPAVALGVAAGLTTGVEVAGAAADINTTVTIRAQGTDLSGVVRSPRPKRCAADREVIVYKQRGARGGGDDVPFASDITSLQRGVYRWSTGNTGTEGRFYARVAHITGCKSATSPTIRATRNP